MTTGKRRKTLFNKTNYIYGLEMLAVLALVIYPKADIDGKAIVCYSDNDNAAISLVENKSETRSTPVTTLLIWHMLAIRGLEHGSNGWARIIIQLALPPGNIPIPFQPRRSTSLGI